MTHKALNWLSQKVPVEKPWKSKYAKFLDSITLDTLLSKYISWTSIGKSMTEFDIRSVLTVEPDEVSALYALWFIKTCQGFNNIYEAQGDTIVGGSSKLLNCMLDEIRGTGNGDLILNSPVEKIVQTDNSVTVFTYGTDNSCIAYTGKYCICTIPPNLVPNVEFDPPLPSEQIILRQRMPMGIVIKVISRYAKPFWREKGYSGNSVNDGEIGPVSETYDYCDMENGFYALIGFITGKDSIQYRRYSSEEEKKKAVCETYRKLFDSEEALNPTEFYEIDWSTEQYSRGGFFSVMPPGILTKWGDNLHKNHKRVHFAGTELATKWAGYMDGAIQSGRVTAQKILSIMKV
jgi:monoamine oxidase